MSSYTYPDLPSSDGGRSPGAEPPTGPTSGSDPGFVLGLDPFGPDPFGPDPFGPDPFGYQLPSPPQPPASSPASPRASSTSFPGDVASGPAPPAAVPREMIDPGNYFLSDTGDLKRLPQNTSADHNAVLLAFDAASKGDRDATRHLYDAFNSALKTPTPASPAGVQHMREAPVNVDAASEATRRLHDALLAELRAATPTAPAGFQPMSAAPVDVDAALGNFEYSAQLAAPAGDVFYETQYPPADVFYETQHPPADVSYETQHPPADVAYESQYPPPALQRGYRCRTCSGCREGNFCTSSLYSFTSAEAPVAPVDVAAQPVAVQPVSARPVSVRSVSARPAAAAAQLAAPARRRKRVHEDLEDNDLSDAAQPAAKRQQPTPHKFVQFWKKNFPATWDQDEMNKCFNRANSRFYDPVKAAGNKAAAREHAAAKRSDNSMFIEAFTEYVWGLFVQHGVDRTEQLVREAETFLNGQGFLVTDEFARFCADNRELERQDPAFRLHSFQRGVMYMNTLKWFDQVRS
ncbi:hypothetical protein F5Y06DRAFT_295614 [Hypoxylon sp. FL0890]|nr:hypothetical protein F5Y06DRAFT_295614 [Hypoxylon sp. FL0890]